MTPEYAAHVVKPDPVANRLAAIAITVMLNGCYRTYEAPQLDLAGIDAAVLRDGGFVVDLGSARDGGALRDTGVVLDAGHMFDAGPPADTDTRADADADGSVFACRGPEDCGGGEVCCGTAFGGMVVASCAAATEPCPDGRVCHAIVDCPSDQVCCPFLFSFPGVAALCVSRCY